jgi:hypothetical protein
MKIQKPIEIDVSLLYKCPNKKCRMKHWLFLRETKNKNFKVICECGENFKPKQVKTICIKYNNKPKTRNIKTKTVPIDLLSKCSTILESYGCSKNESVELISKAYINSPTNDALELVKSSLQLLEINNV